MSAPARRARLRGLDDPPRRHAAAARPRRTRAFALADDGADVVLEQHQLTVGRPVEDQAPGSVPAPPQVEVGPGVDRGAEVPVQPAAAPAADRTAPSAPSAPPPPAAAPSAPAQAPAPEPQADPMAGWEVASSLGEGDAFAQDVAAILAATGPQPAARPSFPLPVPDAQPLPPPQPVASPGAGGQPGHAVFDAMTPPPQRFDAGPVALSVDFAELDRALSREQRTRPAAAPADAPADAPAPAPATPAGPAAAPVSTPPTAPTAPTAAPTPTAPADDDAPWPPPAGSAQDVADVARLAERARPFRVTSDVPLLPQAPGLSCHAAACASMVAWRDDVPADPAGVAAGTGYWERFAAGRTARFPDVLGVFGLAVVDVPVTPLRLRELVDASGPVWVAASPPGEHAVVVAGLAGDGTTSGTLVDVVDPWARGMTTFDVPNPGSRYSVPLAELAAALGGDGGALVLARLQEGMLR